MSERLGKAADCLKAAIEALENGGLSPQRAVYTNIMGALALIITELQEQEEKPAKSDGHG